MTHRLLDRSDFQMVYFDYKWEVLPMSYQVETIVNLMSKNGTYQKCLEETLAYWKDMLNNEKEWDDSLMRCVRGTLVDKLNAYIQIHRDL